MMDGQLSESPLDPSLRLFVPISRVAADVVDGEAVVIDLQTGSYYTTEAVGCDTWQLFATGRTLGEVVDALQGRYAGPAADVETYVQALAQTLVSEGLMSIADPNDEPLPDVGPDPLPPVDTPIPFEPAEFVCYDDMKGLLLLDPVHEVDDRGWPHAAAGG